VEVLLGSPIFALRSSSAISADFIWLAQSSEPAAKVLVDALSAAYHSGSSGLEVGFRFCVSSTLPLTSAVGSMVFCWACSFFGFLAHLAQPFLGAVACLDATIVICWRFFSDQVVCTEAFRTSFSTASGNAPWCLSGEKP